MRFRKNVLFWEPGNGATHPRDFLRWPEIPAAPHDVEAYSVARWLASRADSAS